MELRQLEHFVAVAEERSFTRAARRMHIVQSGLSMSIRALEDEVGTKLFERSARGVALTTAGEAMLPEARRAIAAVSSARVAVDATQGLLRGTLTVGVAQASSPHRITSLVRRFHEEYPGVAIRVVQGSGTPLVNAVHDGRLDLALCGKPIACPAGITTVPLRRGQFAVACAPDHRLAGRESVSLADLADEPFIEMNQDWVSRQHTDHAFAAAGIKRNIACELSDVVLLAQMVQEGLGIAIIASVVVAPITPALKFIPLHPSIGEWQFVASFLGDEPANVAARVFLGMATSEWLSP